MQGFPPPEDRIIRFSDSYYFAFQARYLSDQLAAFPQIYGSIKYLRVHLYLTENVGDQQGWRRDRTPTEDVFSRVFGFKINLGGAGEKHREMAPCAYGQPPDLPPR
ncbi:hypothetical protein [Shinella kummerowiae]|uniref:hypothetical protein n=1 Tax=Shinella kummerowiae TaxID=417745 RepID=UPI0021B5D483|nr:hypothetical protein [Shinella kummerowiae]MCT7664096.1 hypothetical protein [Shinella kummerowiae]